MHSGSFSLRLIKLKQVVELTFFNLNFHSPTPIEHIQARLLCLKWDALTLFSLLLPVTCYRSIFCLLSFPDFGLQFLVIIKLPLLTLFWNCCRVPEKVHTFLISLTSYWICLLRMETMKNTRGMPDGRGQTAPESPNASGYASVWGTASQDCNGDAGHYRKQCTCSGVCLPLQCLFRYASAFYVKFQVNFCF